MSKVPPEADVVLIHMAKEGYTLQEIGDKVGLTRERVRQRLATRGYSIKDLKPASPPRDRGPAHRCSVCGKIEAYGKRRTCSSLCAKVWRTSNVRMVLDPEYRKRHVRAVARWMLANPEKVSKAQRKHARRVLSGKVPDTGRRWVIPGSKTEEALRKYAPARVPPMPKKYKVSA